MILNNDGSFYQENRVNNYAIVNSDQFPIPLIGGTFSVTGFYKETGNLFSFMALSDNMSDDDGLLSPLLLLIQQMGIYLDLHLRQLVLLLNKSMLMLLLRK